MLKKSFTFILVLSLLLVIFSASVLATDNPSPTHPFEYALSPSMTYFNDDFEESVIDGNPVTIYNPYRLNNFDFEEGVYWYNKGANVQSNANALLVDGRYYFKEDDYLSVENYKQWHVDEYNKLYFVNFLHVPGEIYNYTNGSSFLLQSEWFNFWDTSDTRNIGIMIYNYDESQYTVNIKVYGFDSQTGTTDFVQRENVYIDTAIYNKVPTSSLIQELDSNAPDDIVYDYYRIELLSVVAEDFPSEIGFMTPMSVSSRSVLSSDIYVHHSLSKPAVAVSYDNFDLLGWLSSALDGFLTTPILTLGNVSVSLGTCLGVVLGGWLFIVFLKKFAGG